MYQYKRFLICPGKGLYGGAKILGSAILQRARIVFASVRFFHFHWQINWRLDRIPNDFLDLISYEMSTRLFKILQISTFFTEYTCVDRIRPLSACGLFHAKPKRVRYVLCHTCNALLQGCGSRDLVLVSRPIKSTFLRSWSSSWSRTACSL